MSQRNISETLATGEQMLDRMKNQEAVTREEKQILQESKEVVKDVKHLVKAKDIGNKIDTFFNEARKFVDDLQNDIQLQREVKGMATTTSAIEPRQLQFVGNQFLSNLRNVGMEVLRSQDLRDAIISLANLIGDLINNIGAYQGKSFEYWNKPSEYWGRGITSDIKEKMPSVSAEKLKTKEGAKETAREVKESAKEVKGEVQKRLEQTWDQLPLEQRQKLHLTLNKLRSQFRSVMIKISNNPQWNKAIKNLFDLISQMRIEVQQKVDTSQQLVTDKIYNNRHFCNLVREGRSLLESFTSKQTLDRLINNVVVLKDKLAGDVQNKNFLEDWNAWLTDILNHPEKIENEDYQMRFDQLLDRAYTLKDYISPVLDSFNLWLREFSRDEELNRVFRSTSILADRFKSGFEDPRMMEHVRRIVVAFIKENFKTLPVQRYEGVYEGTFGTYFYVLEDIRIPTFDVLPDTMQIRFLTDIDFDVKNMETYKSVATASFIIKDMNADIKNIKFHYKKEASSSYDAGLMDLKIDNAQLVLKLFINPQFSDRLFEIKKVDFSIENLSVSTHDTRSSWSSIYNLFSPYISSNIKQKICENVEENLTKMVDNLNDQLNNLQFYLPSTETLKSNILGISPK